MVLKKIFLFTDPGAEFKEDKKKMVVCSQPSKVEHIIRKSDLPIIGKATPIRQVDRHV